jgi:hypothetical protein
MSPNTEITIINSNSRSYLQYQQGLLPEEKRSKYCGKEAKEGRKFGQGLK